MLKRLFLIMSVLVLFSTAVFAQGSSATPTASPTATPATKAKKPVFRSNKDQVKQAQTMLKEKKVFAGEVTGVSSPEWKTAVKSYQSDNGLTKTGSLNRATLEKMGIALTDKQKEIPVNPDHIASGDSKPAKLTDKTNATKTEAKTSDGPKRPAPFQANKDQITALQTKLKDAKLFGGEANGERSDELKEAIKKYQEANNLKVTGGINAATLEKAGIALTDKQKEQVAAQAAYDAAKAPK
ncbi:MAG: peptidoglycan-binding protein [Pyrinomonadaceae bacterium]|nr:peptidoglycan-binding protein [Pyrinomonadaceae bacterium]